MSAGLSAYHWISYSHGRKYNIYKLARWCSLNFKYEYSSHNLPTVYDSIQFSRIDQLRVTDSIEIEREKLLVDWLPMETLMEVSRRDHQQATYFRRRWKFSFGQAGLKHRTDFSLFVDGMIESEDILEFLPFDGVWRVYLSRGNCHFSGNLIYWNEAINRSMAVSLFMEILSYAT